MKRIYLDYASLTPVDPRVIREMKRYSARAYANPSSIYAEGVAAKKAMADGRERIARSLSAHADEIVFTASGTEANNLAIEGAGRAARRSGNEKPHLIVSAIEHSSVMEMAAMMERHGVEVTRIPVDRDGLVSADDVRKAITPTTYLVSMMAVNNEIGSIQPIRDIAKAVRWAREHVAHSAYPLFHTDAAQAALYNDLNVLRLGVDLMTIDGGKACGPRGIGALYVRRGTPIEQTIYGGGQERGLRSGTENLQAIMGLAKALDLAEADREKERARIQSLKEALWNGLRQAGESAGIRIESNGGAPESGSQSPHILNASIPGIDNEFFILELDHAGIAASTKSSCLRDEDESYVLRAIGADSRISIRFSLGRWTTAAEIRRTTAAIGRILAKKRRI